MNIRLHVQYCNETYTQTKRWELTDPKGTVTLLEMALQFYLRTHTTGS